MKFQRRFAAAALIVFASNAVACDNDDLPSGASVIRGRAGASEIVIATTSRLAGAIHSLTWNGKEFIDSADHGRQLQSAANFDCGEKFIPEVFNPTEAGSMSDGAGEKSSSRLLKIRVEGGFLETTTQMAFWLRPGEKSLGNPARNDRVLSDHLIRKRVQIGYKSLPRAIQYDVTFTVPIGEPHHYAQFEAVTGYMPAEFHEFHTFDPQTRQLLPLSDGPGEQSLPIVFSMTGGTHAMGVYSPDQPSRGYEAAGYGRFRFSAEKVNKWNCVFRLKDAGGIAAGDYSFRTFVIVGSREDVRTTLVKLTRIDK